jgi:transcriptional antiterminator Rof (Rho-off)
MSKDDNQYKPVSCASHSEYELAIMQKRTLRLHWQDARGNTNIEEVLPINLLTRNHSEYLLLINKRGERKQIRLDKITEAQYLHDD